MPDKLRSVEKGLRAVGYGGDVDHLVLSMNRAAERAAPEAKKIFWDAIGKMTIDDAQRILNGTPTAATDYFKDKTGPSLTPALRPIADRALDEAGTPADRRSRHGRGRHGQAVQRAPRPGQGDSLREDRELRSRSVRGRQGSRRPLPRRRRRGAQDPHRSCRARHVAAQRGLREV